MTPLRRLREALGLTQTQVAAVLGCDHSMISHAEAGKTRLGPDLALRVAEAWPDEMAAAGVTLADLLQRTEAA